MFAPSGTVRSTLLVLFTVAGILGSPARADNPDISTIAPDLVIPPVTSEAPAAGKRVFYRLPEDPDSVPHMVLYLPTDWTPGKRYPILVEYAGNGNYKNAYGDVSSGRPESSQLGYGLSGGEGYLWVCLPFLNDAGDELALTWWGDRPQYRPDSTVAFAKRAVPEICRLFSGDSERVILCGFSRGALACNAIGLFDDEIARLWRGFFCYSHHEGGSGEMALRRVGPGVGEIETASPRETSAVYLSGEFGGGDEKSPRRHRGLRRLHLLRDRV